MSEEKREDPEGASSSDSGSSERLRERLDRALDAGGDPLRVLAELLASERREEASVALLDLSGQTIDGFRLKRLLGHGGMGATYLAQAPDESWVAFKVMMADRVASRRRFESEAQVLATLRHPHIPAYLAHGVREDGLGWLAMERIEGPSLEALLQELESDLPSSSIARALAAGCSSPILEQDAWRRRFVRLLIGVADALQHAHERNLVHRDVKPQNVLVRPDLSAVLVDFGIARDTLRPVSLTRTGARVGTPGYMAPEQVVGRLGEIGARTDVFALGLVLWRGLFGSDLFASEEELRRYAARARALLPASAQELGAQLRGVLYHALEPQMRHRYDSARAFAEDLRRLLSDRPVTARGPSSLVRFGRSSMGRRLFLTNLGAALFGAGYFFAMPRKKQKTTVLLTIDAMNRGGAGWIGDRADLRLSVCAGRQEVETGRQSIEYSFPMRVHPDERDVQRMACELGRITKYVDLDASRRNQRVTILSIACGQFGPNGEYIEHPHAPRNVKYGELWDEKGERCLLRLGAGLELTTFWVIERDEQWKQPAVPGYYWVNPGVFEITAVGPRDERETISAVRCDAWQRTEVVLLHKFCLPAHKDRFQFTWGTVFAPKPSGLELQYSDGWVEWVNGKEEDQVPGAEYHIHTALVPDIKGQRLSVEMSISHPERRRIRSGVMMLHLRVRSVDVRDDDLIELSHDAVTLSVNWGHRPSRDMLFVYLKDANASDPVDAETRKKISEESAGEYVTLEVPAEGIERLTLRYATTSGREPQEFGSVEFASGFLGPLQGKHHAFENNNGLAFRGELVPQ